MEEEDGVQLEAFNLKVGPLGPLSPSSVASLLLLYRYPWLCVLVCTSVPTCCMADQKRSGGDASV